MEKSPRTFCHLQRLLIQRHDLTQITHTFKMYFPTFFAIPVACLILTARANRVQASIYQSSDCSGVPTVVYIDVAESHCFAVGGHSFNNFVIEQATVGSASLTTWSGSNCEGSSAKFDWSSNNSGCISLPFAGVQLGASYCAAC